MNDILDFIWAEYGNMLSTIDFTIGFLSGGGIIFSVLAIRNHFTANLLRKAVALNYIPTNILGIYDRESKQVVLAVLKIKGADGYKETYDLPQGQVTELSENESAEHILERELGLQTNDYKIKRGVHSLYTIKIKKLKSVVEHTGFVFPWFVKTKPRGKSYFLKVIAADIRADSNHVITHIGHSEVKLGPTNTLRMELHPVDKARELIHNSSPDQRHKNKIPVLMKALDKVEEEV